MLWIKSHRSVCNTDGNPQDDIRSYCYHKDRISFNVRAVWGGMVVVINEVITVYSMNVERNIILHCFAQLEHYEPHK